MKTVRISSSKIESDVMFFKMIVDNAEERMYNILSGNPDLYSFGDPKVEYVRFRDRWGKDRWEQAIIEFGEREWIYQNETQKDT